MGYVYIFPAHYFNLKKSHKFPSYLANPPQPLSKEDEQRYEKQLVCVKKILEVFEKPDFSDSHQEYGKQIVDLMSEVRTGRICELEQMTICLTVDAILRPSTC
jgi:hypothetical protein